MHTFLTDVKLISPFNLADVRVFVCVCIFRACMSVYLFGCLVVDFEIFIKCIIARKKQLRMDLLLPLLWYCIIIVIL